jgi:hypothetical protein
MAFWAASPTTFARLILIYYPMQMNLRLSSVITCTYAEGNLI